MRARPQSHSSYRHRKEKVKRNFLFKIRLLIALGQVLAFLKAVLHYLERF